MIIQSNAMNREYINKTEDGDDVMKQWPESEINLYLRILESNDAHEIAGNLFHIAELDHPSQPEPLPTGNVEVIAYLEQLIEDRRGYFLILTRSTHTMGELRWLAARVLACEYAYQGIETPIILKDVVQPTSKYEIDEIHRRKKIDDLIQQRLLPTKTEIIKPQDYAHCCSKEAVEERIRNQNKDD